MTRLTLLPMGRQLEVKTGTVLLDAIRQAGVEIDAPCNGQQLCGKCKVRLSDADQLAPVDSSHRHLTAAQIGAGVRLACQVVVRQDMRVTMPDDYWLDTRILEGDRIRQGRIAPAARVRKIGRRFHLCYHRMPAAPLGVWRPDFAPKGIAVDLGTTTLVLTLMDLGSGTELATVSAANPQAGFGHDVMSRIHEASTPQGLEKLFGLIAAELNRLTREACRRSATHPHEIIDAVIGGNTTMLQIAAAIDPSPLGRVPFAVTLQGGRTYPATRFGLNLNPQARAYVPPLAHAFVGGDISAGLLSIDFFNQKAPLLFIDMGTNGEMALSANGHMVVTSTAAGPAFEGMGITHGLRASPGAIEMVHANGRFLNIRTIDDAPARGICGSGIMDIVASLVKLDGVEPGGRLKNPQKEPVAPNPLSDRFDVVDRIAVIKLTDRVYFTQKDIRQFQLAKSAIQTGMEMLLCAAGLRADRLEKLVIAGGFGYHLRVESLRRIGIIPRDFKGDVEFAGNTCRTGCALMLMDAARRYFLEKQMKRVAHLAIAEKPDFQSRFIENISFGR